MNAEAKALVERLNHMRLDGNLSYADLATAIGMDPGGLYKILNGRSEPYDRTLHKIRRFLERPTPERAAKPTRKPKRRAAA